MRADEDVKRAYEAIKDEGIEYPEYYLKPFHAYAEGNLCWLAATEAESATYSMALRVWPKERVDGGDGATAIERFVHGRDQGTSRDAR